MGYTIFDIERVSVQFIPKLNQWYVIPYKMKEQFLETVKAALSNNDFKEFNSIFEEYLIEREAEIYIKKKRK